MEGKLVQRAVCERQEPTLRLAEGPDTDCRRHGPSYLIVKRIWTLVHGIDGAWTQILV